MVGLFPKVGSVGGDPGGGSGFSPDFSWLKYPGGSVWQVNIWNQSADKCVNLI